MKGVIMDIKPYKKDFGYSYTLGAFPTFELVKYKPEKVIEVFVHSSFTDMEKLTLLCEEKHVNLTCNDKIINKLSDKGNVYVVGVFNKFEEFLENCKFYPGCAHVKDKGCAVIEAVEQGIISKSRHDSYKALYEEVKDVKEWQIK